MAPASDEDEALVHDLMVRKPKSRFLGGSHDGGREFRWRKPPRKKRLRPKKK